MRCSPLRSARAASRPRASSTSTTASWTRRTRSSPSSRMRWRRRSASRPSASPPTAPAAPQRAKRARLYELLADFRTQVRRGNATDAGLYEPTAYRAILNEGAQIGEGLDWPWTDLTLDDFVAQPHFRSPPP